MTLTRSQMDEALKALYDRIPAIPDCTGQCWTSCGPIDMSDRERQRIRKRGFEITPIDDARVMTETYYCEALTRDRRCAVYELRPLVCRLWGASESLKCPYGCIPEGGWISDQVAYELIIESGRIGGHPAAVPDSAMARAIIASDGFKRIMQAHQQVGEIGDRLRAEDSIPPAFRRRAERP
jgi:Fe-S-cluster containining protein